MEDSIFTKIIKGIVPAHKIYEDDKALAFLDITPYTTGHTLVIPKSQIGCLWDVDDGLYSHLMAVAKLVANRQRQILSPERVGILVEGFGVPEHAHIHVFPMSVGMQDTLAHKINTPSDIELAEVAKKLKF